MVESGNSGSSPQKPSSANQAEQERQAREQMLRIVFSTEARERLGNVRMVKPELATAVENQVFQLAASGRLRRQITDEELKQMLGTLQQPKRDFKINWK